MNIIKQLKSTGLSKYRISKEIGVSWLTVAYWEREVFNPNEKNRRKLQELLTYASLMPKQKPRQTHQNQPG